MSHSEEIGPSIGTQWPPPPPPPTQAVVVPSQLNLNLDIGGSASARFALERAYGSHDGARMELQGLPPGVTAKSVLAGSDLGTLTFEVTLSAADSAPRSFTQVRVLGIGSDTGPVGHAVITLDVGAAARLTPSYAVIGLVYAPPGTAGGQVSSSVTYASTDTSETSVSADTSFNDTNKVTASLSAGFGKDDSVTIGADYSASQTVGRTDTLTFSHSIANQVQVSGPPADGVDHDYDLIYLWLQPTIIVRVDAQDNTNWTVLQDPQPTIVYLYMKWLNDPATMQAESPGTANALAAAGITPATYPTLLALNPFSTGALDIDPNRYEPVGTLPYEPPLTPSSRPPLQSVMLTDEETSATKLTASQEYEVGVSIEVSVSSGIITGKMSDSASWKWTSTSTRSTTESTKHSATAAVGGPAYGYQENVKDVLVYWDRIYSTFMFALAYNDPNLVGTVRDRDGKARVGQAVAVTRGSTTLRATTDSVGQARFYGPSPTSSRPETFTDGPLDVTIGKQSFQTTVDSFGSFTVVI